MLAVAAALFISERLRVDVIALMVLSALLVLGLVGPDDALAGFSSEATITVAAMFVLSAGLSRSGALLGLGRQLARIRNPWVMLGVVLAVVGPVSAFINNTAAVAVFLPLLLAAALASRRAPSKFLIPLSYVAQMGGVCTLIGTSTNLLVNGMAKQAGEPGFTLFEFSELGLIFMAFGVVYLMVAGPFLLPEREAPALPASDEIGKYVTELRVPAGSALVGRAVADVRALETHRVYVLELIRGDEKHWAPRSTAIDVDDRLLVQGEWPRLTAFADAHGLRLEAVPQAERGVLVEAMVAPNSRLEGRTLDDVSLPQQHESQVVALYRRGQRVAEQLRSLPLTPIALGTAESLGVDAKPMLVAVMFAASTAFATPVGYQTNTMVYSAGGYRFSDFVKIGVPLNLLFFALAIVFIPRYFPFMP